MKPYQLLKKHFSFKFFIEYEDDKIRNPFHSFAKNATYKGAKTKSCTNFWTEEEFFREILFLIINIDVRLFMDK